MIRTRDRATATLIAMVLFSCMSTGREAGANELKVTATTKPIHALVAQVMTGVGTPALLVKGASSPHTYALRPSDAQALHASAVFFRTSETVEPFTAKITAALPAQVRVVTLSEAPGVKRLRIRSGDNFEPHAHGAHEDEHEASHGEHPGEHAAFDGHVWLDPKNARHMVAEIARVLSDVSPRDAPTFKRNAERYASEIAALEASIEKELEPVKGEPFVTFHDAYQYFEHRFGLNAVGAITVSPDIHPSARRLSEIRARIKTLGAKCVFAEPLFQPGLVDAVIEGTGARSAILDPEGTDLEPGPDAYTALMENLSASLRSCLEGR